jgi:hypothetical protein
MYSWSDLIIFFFKKGKKKFAQKINLVTGTVLDHALFYVC